MNSSLVISSGSRLFAISTTFLISAFTLKATITTAADDIYIYFHCFSEKISLDVSSESSARQRIHMKNQVLFSLRDINKKLKRHLLQYFLAL